MICFQSEEISTVINDLDIQPNVTVSEAAQEIEGKLEPEKKIPVNIKIIQLKISSNLCLLALLNLGNNLNYVYSLC